MTSARYLRVVRIGALYDLLAAAAFATPWTARALLGLLARLHLQLQVPGAPPPQFAALHLFFVSLFGTLAVAWAGARLAFPRVEQGLVDGLARAAFAVWMGLALASGQSALLVAFLVPELGFAVAELGGWVRLRRSGAASADAPGAP
jgi:hypothetical protein